MIDEKANYKYDRAIDLLRRIKTEETHERYIDRHKAFDLAISALEKQIPKRPINDTLYWAICPACGGSVSKNNVREYVVEEGTSYGEHCGQA